MIDFGPVAGDCTAALQQTLQTMDPAQAFRLAPGTYQLSAPIDTGVNNSGKGGLFPHCRILAPEGATFVGNFAGGLLVRNPAGADTTGRTDLTGITFRNPHASGIGVYMNRCDGSQIRDCSFEQCGDAGLALNRAGSRTTLDMEMRCLRFSQCGIGADISVGDAECYAFWAYKCKVGISLGGDVNLWGGHCEENEIAVQCGNRRQFNGTVEGLSFEANSVTPIQVAKNSFRTAIKSCRIYGTRSPKYLLDYMPAAGGLSLYDCNFTGGPTLGGVRLAGAGPLVMVNTFVAAGPLPRVLLENASLEVHPIGTVYP